MGYLKVYQILSLKSHLRANFFLMMDTRKQKAWSKGGFSQKTTDSSVGKKYVSKDLTDDGDIVSIPRQQRTFEDPRREDMHYRNKRKTKQRQMHDKQAKTKKNRRERDGYGHAQQLKHNREMMSDHGNADFEYRALPVSFDTWYWHEMSVMRVEAHTVYIPETGLVITTRNSYSLVVQQEINWRMRYLDGNIDNPWGGGEPYPWSVVGGAFVPLECWVPDCVDNDCLSGVYRIDPAYCVGVFAQRDEILLRDHGNDEMCVQRFVERRLCPYKITHQCSDGEIFDEVQGDDNPFEQAFGEIEYSIHAQLGSGQSFVRRGHDIVEAWESMLIGVSDGFEIDLQSYQDDWVYWRFRESLVEQILEDPSYAENHAVTVAGELQFLSVEWLVQHPMILTPREIHRHRENVVAVWQEGVYNSYDRTFRAAGLADAEDHNHVMHALNGNTEVAGCSKDVREKKASTLGMGKGDFARTRTPHLSKQKCAKTGCEEFTAFDKAGQPYPYCFTHKAERHVHEENRRRDKQAVVEAQMVKEAEEQKAEEDAESDLKDAAAEAAAAKMEEDLAEQADILRENTEKEFYYRLYRPAAGFIQQLVAPACVSKTREGLGLALGPTFFYQVKFGGVLRCDDRTDWRINYHRRVPLHELADGAYFDLLFSRTGVLVSTDFVETFSDEHTTVRVPVELLVACSLNRCHVSGDLQTTLSLVTGMTSYCSNFAYQQSDVYKTTLMVDEIIACLLLIPHCIERLARVESVTFEQGRRFIASLVLSSARGLRPVAPGRYYAGYSTTPGEVLGLAKVVEGCKVYPCKLKERGKNILGNGVEKLKRKILSIRSNVLDIPELAPVFPNRVEYQNIAEGFYVRLGSHDPIPEESALSVYQGVRDLFDRELQPLETEAIDVEKEFAEFKSNHPEYTVSQLAEVESCMVRIQQAMHDEPDAISFLLDQMKWSTFGKEETYVPDELKAVRWICCPDMVTRFIYFMFTKRIEHVVRNAYSDATVKGLTEEMKQKRMHDKLQGKNRYAETDFSKMEQNIRNIYRADECRRFGYMFKNQGCRRFAEEFFLKMATANVRLAGRFYRAMMVPSRQSGEGITSIGNFRANCIFVTTVLVLTMFDWREDEDLDGKDLFSAWSTMPFELLVRELALWQNGLAEGDDGIFYFPGPLATVPLEWLVTHMNDNAARLSVKLKFNVCSDYTKLHFCRMRLTPVLEADGVCRSFVVKNVLNVFSKIFTIYTSKADSANTSKHDVKMMLSKAMSAFVQLGHITVVRQVCLGMFDQFKGEMEQLYSEIDVDKVHPILQELREWCVNHGLREVGKSTGATLRGAIERMRDLEIPVAVQRMIDVHVAEFAETSVENLQILGDEILRGLIAAKLRITKGDYEPVRVVVGFANSLRGKARERMREVQVPDLRQVAVAASQRFSAEKTRSIATKIYQQWQPWLLFGWAAVRNAVLFVLILLARSLITQVVWLTPVLGVGAIPVVLFLDAFLLLLGVIVLGLLVCVFVPMPWRRVMCVIGSVLLVVVIASVVMYPNILYTVIWHYARRVCQCLAVDWWYGMIWGVRFVLRTVWWCILYAISWFMRRVYTGYSWVRKHFHRRRPVLFNETDDDVQALIHPPSVAPHDAM